MDESTGERLNQTPCPPPEAERLRFTHSLFVWNYLNVEVEELKVWNCIKAPLLLHMEKEMEDEVN